MPQAYENISFLVGDQKILERIESVPVLPLFSDIVLVFLDTLSKRLLADEEAKKYPDVIAFAFWIREASLRQAKAKYSVGTQRMGWGVAFQITPSNIPIQFAVSMVYALVAGNASVIRVSNKQFHQVDIVCDILKAVISKNCPQMLPYICIVRYNHDDEITNLLSDMCDIRMIWGGNHTISEIRKSKVGPRCLDLGFADRYSLAVIHADEYLECDTETIARHFYNDSYFFDQNACSSPRMVIWVGKNIWEARERFWNTLEALVIKKYSMDPISSSEKLLTTALCAAKYPGVKEIKNNNLLVRLELSVIYNDIMQYKGNCGYFFEYIAEDLKEIVPILQKGCQTITYIGTIENEICKLIQEQGVKGVDRVVSVGRGGSISFEWDGLDLPTVLSRQISAL